MNKLKLEVIFSAITEIDLVEVISQSDIDEDKLTEAIENNDQDELDRIINNLEQNLHLVFKGQTDVRMLDIDTERSTISIVYDGEKLTSNK